MRSYVVVVRNARRFSMKSIRLRFGALALVAVLVAALAVTPVWGSIVRVSAVDPGANLAAGVQTVSSSAVFPPRPAGQSPESKISTPLRLAAQRVQSLAANGAFTDSVP